MVVATKPGTTVPITIYRDNQRKSLNITPDELDLEAEAQGAATAAERPGARSPRRRRDRLRHAARSDHSGDCPRRSICRAAAAAPSSPMSTAAAPRPAPASQPNDIILEVNRQPMTTLTQVTKALQNATAGSPVFLVVWRDGQELFITMSKR